MCTSENRSNIDWFHKARFGIVIHLGLYSLLERGEWVMEVERIPANEYALLADHFNPVSFDADELAALAVDAGARYMVFTARHHDGFCLYDSKVSDFTSVKRGPGRDFLAEHAAACRRAGLKVGVYYSWLDWRYKGYFDRNAYPESFKAMVKQAHEQIRELMMHYGKVDYLWYDGAWLPDLFHYWDYEKEGRELAKLWNAEYVNAMVRELQPHIIINNRSGLPEDVDTPEQKIEKKGQGRTWESCMTMGDRVGWGYVKYNPNMKPVAQLIQYLVQAAAGGGNYLLNIGPKPDGTVREEERIRLREIGKWMKVNGESIYGSEYNMENFSSMIGMTTVKGDTAYLHVFRWPGEVACVAGVAPGVKSAVILASGQEVEFEYRPNGRLILKGLPENPPDPYDTVIAIKFVDGPKAAAADMSNLVAVY